MGRPGRRLEVLAWISVGVFLGLGIYTLQYAEGLSYLSNDPKACVNCHVMRRHYSAWIQGSHHGRAACNDCHVPHAFSSKILAEVENGLNHSIKFTLQNYQEPIRIRRVNLDRVEANCVRCHEAQINQMADHPVKAGEGIRCTECHASVGHLVQ